MPGKVLRRTFLILCLGAVIGAWCYADDLMTRFPNLDYARFRWGVASWYSQADDNIHEYTASGELFDDSQMTCASWEYDFQEQLLVINLFSGRWVVCRVNDRGPGKRLRREIDLTRTAFAEIAALKKGLLYAAVIPLSKK